MLPARLSNGTSTKLCRRPLFPRRLLRYFTESLLRKPAPTRESPRKVVHLNAHYVNEHDILCLRQEFVDLDGGLQLEGDVGIIERYTKQLFKLF